MKIGFLGTGKMATAIARGLIDKKDWGPEQMAGMDISAEAREQFEATTGIPAFEHLSQLAQHSQAIVLGVKPQQAREASQAARDHFQDKLVISIAAGLPLTKLSRWFGHQRIVRVMPNTPSTVGRGMSVYACGNEVTEEDTGLVESVLGAIGMVERLEEKHLDAATALSGSGPAYIFEIMQGLIEAGEAAGLPPETATRLTAQTVAGAAAMVQEKIGSPEELRDAVTSPGGTTEAGLKVLHKGNLRKLIKKTVLAARDRSIELRDG